MLPFLAGLAVGSALTLLYTRRDELKQAVNSPAFKDKMQHTKDLSKQAYNNVKDKVEAFNLSDKAKEIFARFKGESTQKQNTTKSATKKSTTRKTSTRKSPTTKAKTTSKRTKATVKQTPKDK